MPTILAAVAETRTEGEMVAERPWSLPAMSTEERKSRLEVLNGEVQACRKCADIVCYRQQTVFGTGPLQPTVCFMGEAPGADEDRTGEPFVGRAGQLLTKIIEAMQLKREDVFILNALKCRPPQNRTPVPEEIEHCHPFVETQLEILQPKYIVCLGAVAVRSLLGLNLPVGSLRGRFHQYRQSRVVVTYHPSYLLRNESAKKLVWQDMQMLMRELGLKPPGQSQNS
jgi:DNA polymerase